MVRAPIPALAAAVAATLCAGTVRADVFDWINGADETAVWEVAANWRGGVYPENGLSTDAPGGWPMTNSVVYLTNEVPFVQTIQLRTTPDYWNGWKYGAIFADRYHRIGGRVNAACRRHQINDARGMESFIVTRPDTQTYSSADHGPILIVHRDFTNALPQWHVQNYQRVSARGDGSGSGVVGVKKAFGAGMFRVGDDYGNANDAGHFKSANVVFDFEELQTGAEGHMRLMRYANVALHGRTNETPTVAAGAALHLDASAAGTLDVSDGKVTAWRDADGGPVTAIAIGSPTLGTSTNGLAVVACAPRSAFSLSSAVSAREIFVVFRHLTAYNAQSPAFVGNSEGNTEFLRSAAVTTYRYQGLFAGGAGAKHLEAGEVWYDGTRTLPFGLYDDFTRTLHVVSGALHDSTAPVEFIGAESDAANVGGIELAEILVYSRALTSRERREVNSCLRAKWQTPDAAADWDLGSFSYPVSVNGHGNLAIVDGRVAIREIAMPSSRTAFNKDGAGVLEVGRLSPEGMSLNVNGGSIGFRNPEGEVRKRMAADPSVWLDASKAETLVPDPTNSALVCKWNDPRGKNHRGTTIYATNALNKGTIYGRSPRLVNDTPMGRGALDFGPYADWNAWSNNAMGEAGRMQISSAPFREGFMVVKSNDGTRFPTFATGNWEIFGGKFDRFLEVAYCGSACCGGYWTVNGNVCDATAHPRLSSNTYYVVGLRLSGHWYTSPMNVLGGERTAGGDGAGGVSIAEVVYYDRILTPAERRDTEAYLMDKWLGEEHPAARARSIAVPKMTFADGVPVVVDSDVDMAVDVLRGTSGAIVKKGSGNVSIASLDMSPCSELSVSSGKLTVPFGGIGDAGSAVPGERPVLTNDMFAVSVASDAELACVGSPTLRVSAISGAGTISGADVVAAGALDLDGMFTVDGTFSSRGPVSVTWRGDVPKPPACLTLVAAQSLDVDISAWRLALPNGGSDQRRSCRLSSDGQNVYLNVDPAHTLLLLR